MTVVDFKIIAVDRIEGLIKIRGIITVFWEGTSCSSVGTDNRPRDDP
jgi:hypothetical protein